MSILLTTRPRKPESNGLKPALMLSLFQSTAGLQLMDRDIGYMSINSILPI